MFRRCCSHPCLQVGLSAYRTTPLPLRISAEGQKNPVGQLFPFPSVQILLPDNPILVGPFAALMISGRRVFFFFFFFHSLVASLQIW